jgi:hypothetical protein
VINLLTWFVDYQYGWRLFEVTTENGCFVVPIFVTVEMLICYVISIVSVVVLQSSSKKQVRQTNLFYNFIHKNRPSSTGLVLAR